jgi:hypothetical protein
VNTSEVIKHGGLKALVDVVVDAYQQKAKIKALRLINNFLSGTISFLCLRDFMNPQLRICAFVHRSFTYSCKL